MGEHLGAGRAQGRGEGQGRRLADVVRVGLEGEPQQPDPATGQRTRPAQEGLQPGHDLALVDGVGAMDRGEQRRLHVERDRLERDRHGLLGQA